jgi:hypothetical protein
LNWKPKSSRYGGKSADCRLPLQDTAPESLHATVSGSMANGVGFTVPSIQILVLAILASFQIISLLGEIMSISVNTYKGADFSRARYILQHHYDVGPLSTDEIKGAIDNLIRKAKKQTLDDNSEHLCIQIFGTFDPKLLKV